MTVMDLLSSPPVPVIHIDKKRLGNILSKYSPEAAKVKASSPTSPLAPDRKSLEPRPPRLSNVNSPFSYLLPSPPVPVIHIDKKYRGIILSKYSPDSAKVRASSPASPSESDRKSLEPKQPRRESNDFFPFSPPVYDSNRCTDIQLDFIESVKKRTTALREDVARRTKVEEQHIEDESNRRLEEWKAAERKLVDQLQKSVEISQRKSQLELDEWLNNLKRQRLQQLENEARAKAAEQAQKREEEIARQKAAELERRKAKEKADEDARQRSVEEAAEQKAREQAEEAARQKAREQAEEAARQKAREQAEEAARQKVREQAEEVARQKAAELKAREQAEEASLKAREQADEANRQQPAEQITNEQDAEQKRQLGLRREAAKAQLLRREAELRSQLNLIKNPQVVIESPETQFEEAKKLVRELNELKAENNERTSEIRSAISIQIGMLTGDSNDGDLRQQVHKAVSFFTGQIEVPSLTGSTVKLQGTEWRLAMAVLFGYLVDECKTKKYDDWRQSLNSCKLITTVLSLDKSGKTSQEFLRFMKFHLPFLVPFSPTIDAYSSPAAFARATGRNLDGTILFPDDRVNGMLHVFAGVLLVRPVDVKKAGSFGPHQLWKTLAGISQQPGLIEELHPFSTQILLRILSCTGASLARLYGKQFMKLIRVLFANIESCQETSALQRVCQDILNNKFVENSLL